MQVVLVAVQNKALKLGLLEQQTKVIEAVTKLVDNILVLAVAAQVLRELTLLLLAEPQAEQV
jgi:hypothetical protein